MLLIILGKDIAEPIVADLVAMPYLLLLVPTGRQVGLGLNAIRSLRTALCRTSARPWST